MEIRTSAFANGEKIPTGFTGDGEDVSPALTWSAVPNGAKELALICDDPDAPTPEPWVHWVIYKIPVGAMGLAEHVQTTEALAEPTGTFQGRNSWGTIGHRGPAPPPGHGVHHYHFKLYALDNALGVGGGLDGAGLQDIGLEDSASGAAAADGGWIDAQFGHGPPGAGRSDSAARAGPPCRGVATHWVLPGSAR